MSFRFRPSVERLEAREVPAVFSYVVNTVQDLPDANLTDGVPQDALGHVSLRSVMQTINAIPGGVN
ncbi:hypothetical protein QCD71_25090, partial [Sphingomonas sp. PsM26]|nr:hypothetical protein [Sphingomonas sp. PsM26]